MRTLSRVLVNFQLWTIPYELECYMRSYCFRFRRLCAIDAPLSRSPSCVTLAATVIAVFLFPANPFDHVPGRALVLSFLAGLSLHMYRDKIPYSSILGVIAVTAAAMLLQIPNTSYLAAFPVSYLTVWLGVMRPPKIPFGDLSYGVYLFHFPLEQSIVHLFPDVGYVVATHPDCRGAEHALRMAIVDLHRAARPEP